MVKVAALGVLLAAAAAADVRHCACEVAVPETMAARECGLCREAEKHPVDAPVFILKDINPRKPNRWLALPRAHGKAQHQLADMTPEARLALWTAAIEKARSVFGDKWGLAVNGDESRTQCHAHIHIGKLLEGIETGNFIVVDGPAQIPALTDGLGIWVHPEGNKLHVHLGEQITETVLFR
jgi:diadenosine tetraphosphate (Ap4A) HIT family hydrolase